MEFTPSSRLGVVMLVSHETTVTITGAFTKDGIRHCGIGIALLNHSLDWARSIGYSHCTAEYDSTNIIGSRFWQRRGFKPVGYSWIRSIDKRIADTTL